MYAGSLMFFTKLCIMSIKTNEKANINVEQIDLIDSGKE